MQTFRVAIYFTWSIVKKLWVFIPAILSDPYDILERWLTVNIPSPQWLFYILLGLGLIVAIGLTIRDYKNSGRIKLNPEIITDLIWDLYYKGQNLVLTSGKKVLKRKKFEIVRKELQKELNIPDIPVSQDFALSKDEGRELLDGVMRVMEVKMKNDTHIDKPTLTKLAVMGKTLDENDAGVIYITSNDDDYRNTEIILNKKRAKIKSQKEVRNTLSVIYILNTIMLAFIVFGPRAQRRMPENKIPQQMLKKDIDEVMSSYMNDLSKVLERRG